MNINLITIGKLKENYLREACAEYIKRLKRFCKINIIELDEERISDNPSEKEIAIVLKKESMQIKKHMSGTIIPLCIEGKQLSSIELSKFITLSGVQGNSTISFIIGSSHGLDPEIKNMGSIKLSMSKMTFPHQLARVMLLEQVYRCFNIIEGGKYHK